MRITKVKIENYRNLDGMSMSLAKDCNFIVGENNVGKSNLLSLLHNLLTARTFRAEDFKDGTKPIEVGLRISLAPVEIGQFEDLFEIDDPSSISIIAKQESLDEYITFRHSESDTFIPVSTIRAINFVHYDSLRNPTQEINFDKGRGVGRFLANVVARYLQVNKLGEEVFIDDTKVNQLIDSVNGTISKIKAFKDFGILATSDGDSERLLCNIVKLKDLKGDELVKAGYGVQFLILVTLSILEKLQGIHSQRGEKGVFQDGDSGKKSISLILGLDEPEIHLHPYMQRSLLKYLASVISNQNSDFRGLIKELFDIDEINGQIIVVTHSPNIILNDYQQISRVFVRSNNLEVVAGCELSLNPQLEKHLHLQFPFIKEAFFSRCAIFVEGDSEFGALPYFARSLDLELDDLGICVIQARGDAVALLMSLAKHFGIPSVGVTDKGDGTRTISEPDHYETTQWDFEAELVALVDSGNESRLREIVCLFDSLGEQREMPATALDKIAFRKHGLVTSPFAGGLKLADIALTDVLGLKSFYLTWFSTRKSRSLGTLIGQQLLQSEIPNVYATVLAKAQDLALNA